MLTTDETGNAYHHTGVDVENTLHRTDGPAVELADGTKEYWINGLRHRADGPAVEHPNGTREWWLHGALHREGGPAIERLSEYWLNGKFQKEEYLPV